MYSCQKQIKYLNQRSKSLKKATGINHFLGLLQKSPQTQWWLKLPKVYCVMFLEAGSGSSSRQPYLFLPEAQREHPPHASPFLCQHWKALTPWPGTRHCDVHCSGASLCWAVCLSSSIRTSCSFNIRCNPRWSLLKNPTPITPENIFITKQCHILGFCIGIFRGPTFSSLQKHINRMESRREQVVKDPNHKSSD